MFTCSCRPERHKAERLDSLSQRHALYSGKVCGCGETFATYAEWGEHFRQVQGDNDGSGKH